MTKKKNQQEIFFVISRSISNDKVSLKNVKMRFVSHEKVILENLFMRKTFCCCEETILLKILSNKTLTFSSDFIVIIKMRS